jgi:hypothetical protein
MRAAPKASAGSFLLEKNVAAMAFMYDKTCLKSCASRHLAAKNLRCDVSI